MKRIILHRRTFISFLGIIKFQGLKTRIYLDYQATTPLEDEVLKAITGALDEAWGNPSSGYQEGVRAKVVIDESRQRVAEMINATPTELIFTSGGTESNCMVLHTCLKYYAKVYPPKIVEKAKPHFIATNIEHDSILKVLQHYELEGLADVSFVPVSLTSGQVPVQDILSAVRPNTCLVSVMLANNETGIIQPVSEISSALQSIKRPSSPRVLLHTDAAQAFGKVPVDVSSLGVDYLTVVGHKFYGPRIGALYARIQEKSVPLYPMLYGGGQERNFRPGTENTGMIAGLGKASELVCKNLDQYSSHMGEVRDYLEQQLLETFKDGVVFNAKFAGVNRLPNICNVSFVKSGMSGRDILNKCEVLQASVGAACHTGSSSKASPILLAVGVPPEVAVSALRLSVGRHTTTQQIDRVIDDLKQAVQS